jgi:hypothetical protein
VLVASAMTGCRSRSNSVLLASSLRSNHITCIWLASVAFFAQPSARS